MRKLHRLVCGNTQFSDRLIIQAVVRRYFTAENLEDRGGFVRRRPVVWIFALLLLSIICVGSFVAVYAFEEGRAGHDVAIVTASTCSCPGLVAHPDRYIIQRKDGLIHVIRSSLKGYTNRPAATGGSAISREYAW